MRKTILLTVLSLFLLVPASITRAQKVSVSGNVYEKGTVKNTFTTPYGSITTILPDDIRPGDQISGTVNYAPEGRRDKEKNKNKIELLKYSLSVEPNRRTGSAEPIMAEALKDIFILQNKPQATMHGGAEAAQDVFVTEFTIPATYSGNNLDLILRDAQKNIIAQSSSPIVDITIPDLSGYAARGRYWGDQDNKKLQPNQPERIIIPDKKIYMGGELAQFFQPIVFNKRISKSTLIMLDPRTGQQTVLIPLAGSPRKTIVEIPPDIFGPVDLILKDQNQKTIGSEKLHVLQLEASCPKTNLMKGESTVLGVKVKGIPGCPADYLRLNLDNTTSRAVQMGQSNHEQLFIEPVTLKYSSVMMEYAVQKEKKEPEKNMDWGQTQNKEFFVQRPITALQTGNFNIDITLSYPSSVYNDPLRQQLDALKTVDQFDDWRKALYYDLVRSLPRDIRDGMGKILTPTSTPVDEAKSRIYARFADVYPSLPPTTRGAMLNSIFEAGRTAAQNGLNESGKEPLHYEVIEAGLQAARQVAEKTEDSNLRNSAESLRDRLLKLQREMQDFSERTKTLEEILKLFTDAQRSATNNMRASTTTQNGKADSTDALTDGLLLIRYLFETASQMPAVTDIKGQAKQRSKADSTDGSGTTDALTDGLLLMRYGSEQEAMISEKQLAGMDASRKGKIYVGSIYYPKKTAQTDGVMIIRYLFGLSGSARNQFEPQLRVLQTAEDFNNWSQALKKDLRQLITPDARFRDLIIDENTKSAIQTAIDKLPVCTGSSDLDACKNTTAALLEPLNIPEGASNCWLNAYEAFKTASMTIPYWDWETFRAGKAKKDTTRGSIAIPYWPWETFRAGLRLIKRNAFRQNDPSLVSRIENTEQLLETLDKSSSPTKDQLADLRNSLQSIVKSADQFDLEWNIKNLLYESFCLNKLRKDGIDPSKSTVAYLDPDNKVLHVRPEYQQQVLASLNAIPAGNGLFKIQSLSATRTPVSYMIRILPILVGNIYDGDWWANELIKRIKADTAAGKVISTTKDSTGTWWIFYKDAKCTPWANVQVEGCHEHESFEYDSKTGKGKFFKDGKYFKIEFLPGGSCKKGTDFCTEMWQVFRLDYIYADKDCKKLIQVDKTMGFSCQ